MVLQYVIVYFILNLITTTCANEQFMLHIVTLVARDVNITLTLRRGLRR